MDNSVKELDFVSLQKRFDDVCEDVNKNRRAAALALKSGRKVFIMPEENYDNISRFIVENRAGEVYLSKAAGFLKPKAL